MKVRVHSLLRCAMLIALGAAVSSAHAKQVVFRNELLQCVTIETTGIWTESNLVLANTLIQIRKPIGECGCLSALAAYASSVDREKTRQTLQEGVIGLKSGGEKTLVLATEPALVADKKITVRLSCAGPL